jgi:hypothetical protein
MIDQELKDIIIYKIGIIVDKQSERLLRDIAKLKADAGPRGFPSMTGDTQWQIKERHERYYSDLPRLIIQEMRDVLLKAKPKPSPELSKYLKDIVSSPSISRNELIEYLRFQNIDSAVAETVIISSPSRFFSEIDLIIKEIENLEKGEGMGSETNITTYNINAPGGIVQTGNNAMAKNIVINNDNKQELYKAIDIIFNAISNANDFHSSAKEETKAMICEVKTEVEKPQPNGIKLKSLLFGIGTTIQSLASMKPAYEALKTAASVIGIHLP